MNRGQAEGTKRQSDPRPGRTRVNKHRTDDLQESGQSRRPAMTCGPKKTIKKPVASAAGG